MIKKLIPALALALIAAPAHADITVGLAGPLTGQYAAIGEQMKRGAEQAVADINAQGGVFLSNGGAVGEKLVLREADDACDPKQAVTVANNLVSEGAKFVVGHFCSGSSIPASKVYGEEGVIMISPGSTHPALTEAGLPYIFRVCGRDDQQGVVDGQYILHHFAGKKVAIIHDNSTAGRGQGEQVKKTLNENHVAEVMFDSYMPGTRDYAAMVSKLKNAGAEVLFVGGYYTEVGLLTRQLKEQGAKIQVMGGDALMTDAFWSISGPAGEGVLMSFSPDPRKRPEAKDAIAALRKTGYEPEGYTLYAYAAVQAIAEGIKRAGKPDPAKVAQALRQGPIKTVLGDIGFDAKGDVTGATYVLYKWHDGKYAEVGN